MTKYDNVGTTLAELVRKQLLGSNAELAVKSITDMFEQLKDIADLINNEKVNVSKEVLEFTSLRGVLDMDADILQDYFEYENFSRLNLYPHYIGDNESTYVASYREVPVYLITVSERDKLTEAVVKMVVLNKDFVDENVRLKSDEELSQYFIEPESVRLTNRVKILKDCIDSYIEKINQEGNYPDYSFETELSNYTDKNGKEINAWLLVNVYRRGSKMCQAKYYVRTGSEDNLNVSMTHEIYNVSANAIKSRKSNDAIFPFNYQKVEACSSVTLGSMKEAAAADIDIFFRLLPVVNYSYYDIFDDKLNRNLELFAKLFNSDLPNKLISLETSKRIEHYEE